MNKLISVSIGILLITLSTPSFATKDGDWNKLLKEIESGNPQFFIDILKKKTKYKKNSTTKDDGLSKKEIDEKKLELKNSKKKRRELRKLSKKLLKATRHDDYEKIKEYILAGADPTYSKKNGETSLHVASAHGNLHIVRVLETHGADLNATTIKGWTPLHHAARFGHLEVVRYLMSKGANMHLVNSDGKSAYALAHQIRHDDITKFLRIWQKYH